MCGIFGFVTTNKCNGIEHLDMLTNALAYSSSLRGTDATGIAYNNANKIQILKTNKAAFEIQFNHKDSVKALVGHTRHSTRGDCNKNYNNHPFFGKTKYNSFALAHNGVLWNYDEIRKARHIKENEIQTDSYIAVQILEQSNRLSLKSLKDMAETVSGSFSFNILDNKDNLYLVKGDSPISLLYFYDLGIYVYASTDDILKTALSYCKDFKPLLKEKRYIEHHMVNGDIWKINHNGIVSKSKFEPKSRYGGRQWWQY